MSAKSQHKDGKVGGVLVGRKHRDGGIKIKNISTGEPIEAEGGEVIITANAVSDQTRHNFNGRKMSNLEILSSINESAGGVAFYKQGGRVEGPVKCGCTGKHHMYNGEKLSDREILKRMAEGGAISREIKSANDFELLTAEELLALEFYRQYKPAFRKESIARAFSDGYPHHEHLEKAEALISQLKKIGFITPQNALSEQGKLAVQKTRQKLGRYSAPSLPNNIDTYNRWWLTYFEGTQMAHGGTVMGAQALRAKQADLIILPDNVQGTNCSNCRFVNISDKATGQGYCRHPQVDQPVSARMCCIYWDAPGTQRVWQLTGKMMQRGGEVSLHSPNDIIQFQTGVPVNNRRFAKGGKIDLSDKHGQRLKISDIPASVAAFMPLTQQKAIVGSKEHWGILERLANIIAEMPEVYETEDVELEDKIVYLRYFSKQKEKDWYIVEKDEADQQHKTWGFVTINRHIVNATWDFIDIEAIKNENGVELDLHFNPQKFNELAERSEGFAKGGKIDLSDKHGQRLKISDIPESVKTFMPAFQQKVIVGSEEHWDVLERLATIIAEMPKTYETESINTDDKIVYLHYFYGDSDWYIVEKDMEPEQLQAFGYVILNGDLDNAEWGYISIEEIKATNRVELDFYFEPIKFSELKKKWAPEEEKAAIAQSNNLILGKGTWVDLKRIYRGHYDRAKLLEDYYEGATDLYVECCASDSQPQKFTVAADDIILPDPQKPTEPRYPDDLFIKFRNQKMFEDSMAAAGFTQYMSIYEPGSEKLPEGIYAINPQNKQYLTWNEWEEAVEGMKGKATISEIAKADDRIMIVRPSHGNAPEEMQPANIPQASTKTAKQQAAINQQIIKLVKQKGTDSSQYSASEIALLKQYSGAGGLSKHGASGPRILDQFFTPMNICSKMWGLALQHGFNFKNTAICEPSVGTGNFLQFIPRDAKVEAVGYEVDEISHTICKILFPQYDIRHGSFESMFFTGRRHIGLAGVTTFFDLVIGNPPYREYVSPFAKLGEADATGAFTFEMYFIMRGIDVLKPGGLLIYIVPNTFLSNDKKYNPFKIELAKKADLVDAYRLPNGVFDFTGVGTDIIVLRKKK